jgi:hypothetical protein
MRIGNMVTIVKRKLAMAAAIAFLGGRLIWLYVIPSWQTIITDFPNYYVSAWAVRHGDTLNSLYDPVWFDGEKRKAGIERPAALFNYFPPTNALILWPLADMEPIAAKRLWTVISLIALIGVIYLVGRASGLSWSAAALIALLGGDALGNNFTYGQFYIVLTSLMLMGVLLAKRYPSAAGLASGAAALTKLFPAFLLVYLAIRREYRALMWSVIAIAVLGVAGIMVMGWAPHHVYLQEVLGRSLRGEIQDPYNVHWNTFQALLRRAFVGNQLLNPQPIFDAPWLFFFLRPLTTFAIVVATLYAIARARNAETLMSYGALIGMVSLITPSQASYHQFLFFPAVAGLAGREAPLIRRVLPVVLFALICSNVMGATARFDQGIAMLLGFPRVWLVAALWGLFLDGLNASKSRISRTGVAVAAAVVVLVAAVAYLENRRWIADDSDGSTLVSTFPAADLELQPRFIDGRLVTSVLAEDGLTNPLPVQNDTATSPDGRWTAFTTNARGNWDIAIRSNQTGETRLLTTSSANDVTPTFSPDGRFVYFASDRHRGYRFTTIYRKGLAE